MLKNLIEPLPPRRHRFLHEQMRLLDAELQRYFPDPEDRKAAGIADYAGIGGVVDPRSGTDKKI